MIVGCYSIDLYCDYENSDHRWDANSNPPAYIGETEAECLRAARKDGWKFTRERPRKAKCPICVKIKNDIEK